MKLKEYFGDDVDFYGRGFNEFNDKSTVLDPYYFSLAIENTSFKDYFTEKIVDCYLTDTVPLYYGAPNITDYFPENSLIKIDLNDFENALKVINNLKSKFQEIYLQKYPYVQAAKKKALNEHAFIPNIINMINKKIMTSIGKPFGS